MREATTGRKVTRTALAWPLDRKSPVGWALGGAEGNIASALCLWPSTAAVSGCEGTRVQCPSPPCAAACRRGGGTDRGCTWSGKEGDLP